MLPEPDCTHGYSFDLLEETLGKERFDRLMHWMRGQTMMLCDGRRYDHDAKSYEETHEAHGPVVYAWDAERFLAGGPILD
jgi:hypothetical protein